MNCNYFFRSIIPSLLLLMLGTSTYVYADIYGALDLRRQGDFQGAVLELERLLNINPNSVKLQVELAATYSHMGDKVRANELFEQLLAQPDLDPVVRKNIIKFQNKYMSNNLGIAAVSNSPKSRHKLSLFTSIIRGHDSNVNGPIAVDIIDDSDDSEGEEEGELVLQDNYQILKSNIRYKYKFKEKIKLESGKAIAEIKLGANYYYKQYSKEEAEHRNLTTLKSTITPILTQAGKWRFQVPLSIRRVALGGNASISDSLLVTYYGVRPSFSQYFNWGILKGQLELIDRQYEEMDQQDKDGLKSGANITFEKYVVDNVLTVEFGFNGQFQRADGKDARAYQRLLIHSQLTWRPTKTIKTFFKYSQSDYVYQGVDIDLLDSEGDILYPYRRKDTRTTWQTGISASILPNVKVSAMLSALHIESNQTRYNYDRVKSELGMSVAF